ASFHEVEHTVVGLVFALGRLLLALFLCTRHDDLATPASERREEKRYVRGDLRRRVLATFFGKVCYWRAATRRERGGGGDAGYFPLDRALGLPADGFSAYLASLMARVATKVSYAQTTLLLRCFLGWAPAHRTVEKVVLGLGKHTQAWFAQAPAPRGDGDVLVIQVDGKSPPTATEAELRKRRGKRKRARVEASPRHRGRARRRRRGPKKRRKKGDKSKNGRMVTTVVMYTLQSGYDVNGKPVLKGPINRWVYSSFAPKRHAFAVARREADRRGFGAGSGKRIQIVTDGDEDLARNAGEFFPEAIHTLDVIHAIERLWTAGRSVHREGSKALASWVGDQKKRLLQGHSRAVLRELGKRLNEIPRTGPGNKGKRKRLKDSITYLEKRAHMMKGA
ncbi:MAG: hypothetical protein AB1778_07780, partial [Candidatus Bipolaricaulota bacterium]